MSKIRVKSIYAEPEAADGFRVFVDRLLPPGITEEGAQLDLWLGGIAPSPRLHKWYGNDRSRWDKFLERYYEELDQNGTAVTELFQQAKDGPLTLLFAAKDMRCNTAVALKQYLAGQ